MIPESVVSPRAIGAGDAQGKGDLFSTVLTEMLIYTEGELLPFQERGTGCEIVEGSYALVKGRGAPPLFQEAQRPETHRRVQVMIEVQYLERPPLDQDRHEQLLQGVFRSVLATHDRNRLYKQQCPGSDDQLVTIFYSTYLTISCRIENTKKISQFNHKHIRQYLLQVTQVQSKLQKA
jgi:hypothetical protein